MDRDLVIWTMSVTKFSEKANEVLESCKIKQNLRDGVSHPTKHKDVKNICLPVDG